MSEPHPFTVAIDFDGTLSEYDGWRGKGVFGDPIKDAVAACWLLHMGGCRLLVWTCRHNEETAIHEWLQRHDFPPFAGVNVDMSGLPDRSPKIVADVYVDDRGAGWGGWAKALAWIENHRKTHYPVHTSHLEEESA